MKVATFKRVAASVAAACLVTLVVSGHASAAPPYTVLINGSAVGTAPFSASATSDIVFGIYLPTAIVFVICSASSASGVVTAGTSSTGTGVAQLNADADRLLGASCGRPTCHESGGGHALAGRP
jgi:hypothetical protein